MLSYASMSKAMSTIGLSAQPDVSPVALAPPLTFLQKWGRLIGFGAVVVVIGAAYKHYSK
jgi:hypothetical protein